MISFHLAMFVLPAGIIALAVLLALRARLRPTGSGPVGPTGAPEKHSGS